MKTNLTRILKAALLMAPLVVFGQNSSLTNGLMAYYTFEGNANDVSGNEHHGTASGNYHYLTEGLSGGALRITGDGAIWTSGGGHVILPTFGTNLNNGFTLSLWAKDESGNNETYIAFGALNLTRAEIWNDGNGELRFTLDNGGSGVEVSLFGLQPFHASWKHLILSYHDGTMRGYFNGQEVFSTNRVFNIFPVGHAALGRHWWNGGASSSTRMSVTYDNVRIYNRALSSNEVAELYAQEAPFSVSVNPVSVVAYYGNPILLEAQVNGAPPFSFQWSKDGEVVPGATNASLQIQSAQLSDSGFYKISVSNPYTNATSTAISVEVREQIPVFTLLPNSQTVLAGESVEFSASAIGGPVPNYQWHFNGSLLANATNAVLSLQNVTTNEVGEYSVVAFNSAGAVTSAPAQLMVLVFAPDFLVQPTSRMVFDGANVTFSCLVTSSPPAQYQWLRNGEVLPGATLPYLKLRDVDLSDGGFYKLQASNEFGAVFSESALLTVLPYPSLSEAVDNPSVFWATGGAAPWLFQTNITHDGFDAVQSGPIQHNQETWISTTVRGPGVLTFWWKVSSESGFDRLRFLTNGVAVTHISGEQNWTNQTVVLLPGTQVLKWQYSKDASSTAGLDAAWLDQIIYLPNEGVSQASYLTPRQSLRDGRFRMTLHGLPGQVHEVQVSTNLTTWEPVTTVTNISGPTVWHDPTPLSGQRFYRLATP